MAFPIYIGTILRRDTQNYSYIYRNTKLISVIVSLPHLVGKSFCVGVRYFTVAFPIYIGTILRRDTQNYSYIYRNTKLISVIVSLPHLKTLHTTTLWIVTT